ncbi:hypothetical protein [Microtetraspora sp. NBRC 16547]|uniref:hypothetical protein n=1 Tax=Microtetraspora sp. NBRC 16547 TaxID=3030993 RepID=UPI0024A1B547|nr:hypothetical protein [Microtetraspora sp. NBRC 16547]GLX00094.1 hypothetical protein Misp02_41800 [Microtetraspora sp. NBRC 16547]
MRKSLRLAVAAATGAALFATGAAITVASPANAVSAVALRADGDISDLAHTGDLFIPPTGSDKIGFSFNIEDPYVTDGDKKGEVKYKAWVRYTTDKSANPVAWKNGDVTQLTKSTASPIPTGQIKMTGSISLSSSDKPGDKWQIQVAQTNADVTTAPTDGWKSLDLDVKAATRVNGASVSPNPVRLKSGKEVDVFVSFELEKSGDEKVTDVRLESKSYDDYYSLGTGMESDGKSFHNSTSFDYSTSTGAWQLKITVSRGSKTYSFVKGFEVSKTGSSKSKSKITLSASPSSVKKGKTTKLSGKVYRGSNGWGKKIMKLYFKKKGSSKWGFVGYVGATSTGKFSKTVKPKYTGYWRLAATGTSTTYGSYSNNKLVSVK